MQPLTAYHDPTTLPMAESVRLAMMLGIPRPKTVDDLSLAKKVANGLPLRSVDAMRRLVDGFEKNAIYGVVSEPTLRRARERNALTPVSSERLYEFSRVLDRAARVFHGDEGRVRRFMMRPHPLLGGETPFDLARASSAGAQAVIRLLEEAEAGVAV